LHVCTARRAHECCHEPCIIIVSIDPTCDHRLDQGVNTTSRCVPCRHALVPGPPSFLVSLVQAGERDGRSYSTAGVARAYARCRGPVYCASDIPAAVRLQRGTPHYTVLVTTNVSPPHVTLSSDHTYLASLPCDFHACHISLLRCSQLLGQGRGGPVLIPEDTPPARFCPSRHPAC
jgi:hypothetical protein